MKFIGTRSYRIFSTKAAAAIAVLGLLAGTWWFATADALVQPTPAARVDLETTTAAMGGTPCCLDEWQSQYNCPSGERWACICVGPACTGCSEAAGGTELGCIPDSTLCFQ